MKRDGLTSLLHPPSKVPIHALWHVVMAGLESIWPGGGGRTTIEGRNMGDVWPHSALPQDEGADDASAGYVPFHKLSQWLTYSLMEPLAEAGLSLTETGYMTGLPEYRNGGLFVDLGVLAPKDPGAVFPPASHKPDSELIVEWRALTVILLVSMTGVFPNPTSFPFSHLPTHLHFTLGTLGFTHTQTHTEREEPPPSTND